MWRLFSIVLIVPQEWFFNLLFMYCLLYTSIAVLSLIFMGMVEYGYVTGGKSFGNWKVHLGLIPYVAWLVLTYIATRPKWFIKRYNPKEMFEVHRIVGIVSVVLVCAHWYVCLLYTSRRV